MQPHVIAHMLSIWCALTGESMREPHLNLACCSSTATRQLSFYTTRARNQDFPETVACTSKPKNWTCKHLGAIQFCATPWHCTHACAAAARESMKPQDVSLSTTKRQLLFQNVTCSKSRCSSCVPCMPTPSICSTTPAGSAQSHPSVANHGRAMHRYKWSK